MQPTTLVQTVTDDHSNDGSLIGAVSEQPKPAKIGAPETTKKLKINSLHTEAFQRVPAVGATDTALAGTPLASSPAPLLNVADPERLYFSSWTAWTPCRMSGERRIRRRKCLDLKKCRGTLMQFENCPVQLALVETTPADSIADDGMRS